MRETCSFHSETWKFKIWNFFFLFFAEKDGRIEKVKTFKIDEDKTQTPTKWVDIGRDPTRAPRSRQKKEKKDKWHGFTSNPHTCTHGGTDGWMDEWTDGRTDGRMHRQMDGQINGRMDKAFYRVACAQLKKTLEAKKKEIKKEKQLRREKKDLRWFSLFVEEIEKYG